MILGFELATVELQSLWHGLGPLVLIVLDELLGEYGEGARSHVTHPLLALAPTLATPRPRLSCSLAAPCSAGSNTEKVR